MPAADYPNRFIDYFTYLLAVLFTPARKGNISEYSEQSSIYMASVCKACHKIAKLFMLLYYFKLVLLYYILLLSFGGLSPKLGIYPQFRDTISSSGIYQFPSQSIPMVSLYRGQSKKLKLAILIFQIKYQIIIITISFLVQMYAYVIKDEQIGNQNISYTNVRAILTLLVHE